MVPDGRTDGMDGRTHGRRQNYIPPTSSGDNNALNSFVDWVLTTEGDRLFQCGIVWEKGILQGITVCLVSVVLSTM